MPFSGRKSKRIAPFKDGNNSILSVESREEDDAGVVVLELTDPNADVTGATLSAHDISFKVPVRERCWRRAQKKQILSKITGVFKPGLNAILGTTGAGKTTFMNTLAGRVDKRFVEGTFLLNGNPIPDNFKCMVGYVVQDDLVMGSLTVRENFAFSSSLRLPSSVSRSEREERIERVIVELGLQHCADTKIGTTFIRGVSGGERKRCNIGMELIISPPVLFLDEPTSGLDASTANTVLMFLKRISDRGRTIIFSIHQPRYSIYKLFDNIMLLSRGQTIFHGKASDTLEFFESQGFRCQDHNNPPDFFLDVINADQSTLQDVCSYNPSLTGDNNFDQIAIQTKLVTGFKDSDWHKRLHQEASQIYSSFENKGRQVTFSTHNVEYATSFIHQCLVLTGRTLKDLVRNPQTGLSMVTTSLFFAIIMGGLFWQLDEDPVKGFLDRAGVLFFMVLVQIFFNLSAMEIFVREKVMLMHENTSGFYRMSVYFLVKLFSDILPLRLVGVCIMALIVYFAVDGHAGFSYEGRCAWKKQLSAHPGLRNSFEAFILFAFCLMMVSMAATATCFFCASVFQTFAAAQMVMSLVNMVMLLFSGYMVNMKSVADWISWLQYASFVKYGIAALYVNEFKDRTFCSSNGTICKDGNLYLSEINVDYETSWDFWKNYIALALFTLIFLIGTYIQLRRLRMHS